MSESSHDDMRLCYRIFGFKQEPGSNQIYSASAHDEKRNEFTTSPVST